MSYHFGSATYMYRKKLTKKLEYYKFHVYNTFEGAHGFLCGVVGIKGLSFLLVLLISNASMLVSTVYCLQLIYG